MGINFSRALTLKYGPSVSNYMRSSDRTVISVGRVMTCVLGMVVRREREIREFVKTPFYRVIGTFGPAGISIDGEWRAVEGSRYYGTPCLYKENGFKERKDAEALIAWLWERENGSENSGVMQSEVSDAEKADAGLMGVYNTSQGTILKVEKKKETKNPPLLYNLAELQNDCSKMFKISPDQTLSGRYDCVVIGNQLIIDITRFCYVLPQPCLHRLRCKCRQRLIMRQTADIFADLLRHRR